MSPQTYRELQAAGLPMSLMAVDPRRVFVGPRPLAAGGATTPVQAR
jgi:hypothetical protein